MGKTIVSESLTAYDLLRCFDEYGNLVGVWKSISVEYIGCGQD